MIPRIPLAASGALVLALALTACSSPAEPSEEPKTPESVAPAPSADAEPVSEEPETPEEPSTPEVPTCDELISSSMVADYADLGMTAHPSDFTIGEVTLETGISCLWSGADDAEFGQTYAWGLITEDQVAAVQDMLVTDGWTMESADEGTYYTEDPAFAIGAPDENGYAATYLFGDGWVIFADTKQSLILIDRP